MNQIIGRIVLAGIGLTLLIGLAGCNSAPVQEGTPPGNRSGGSPPNPNGAGNRSGGSPAR